MKSIIWIFIFALNFSHASTEWFSPSTAFAQKTIEDPSEEEEFGEEEENDLDGFEEEDDDVFGEIKIDSVLVEASEPETYSYGGFIKQEFAYSYQTPDSDFQFTRDKAELNKIRSVLNLYFQFKLSEVWKGKISANAFYDAYYSQKDRDLFSDETLSNHEREVELRDTFIEGPLLENLWIKTGRQIIAWGESEGTAIVDLANPRDNRELGLVDIEDARIPITATKLSYLGSGWELNAVVLHEFRFNKRASEGTDFDPYIGLRGSFAIEDDALPEGDDSDEE